MSNSGPIGPLVKFIKEVGERLNLRLAEHFIAYLQFEPVHV